MTMQHADARFERTQPAALKRVPFAPDENELVPSAIEAVLWALIALAIGAMFVGFLGM